MNAEKYVSMVHFPFATKLWAFAPRIKGAIMKCDYTWTTLTITAVNRARNKNNGFSSEKGQFLTNKAKKDVRQTRTKATIRFRCERRRPSVAVKKSIRAMRLP